jgi:hypothetical protein
MKPSYRMRPAIKDDLEFRSGAVIEINTSDPPAPIWTGGLHIPHDRLPEVIALLEIAFEKGSAG